MVNKYDAKAGSKKASGTPIASGSNMSWLCQGTNSFDPLTSAEVVTQTRWSVETYTQ